MRQLVVHELQRALQLQAGGGLRDLSAVDDLLTHGVARVVVGSAVVDAPEAVESWLHQYGAERVCLAFDVRLDGEGVPLLYTRGWLEATRVTLWEAIERFAAAGLKHVLCTDIDRDGALTGPNVALYRERLARSLRVATRSCIGRPPAASPATRICRHWPRLAPAPRSAARRCSSSA